MNIRGEHTHNSNCYPSNTCPTHIAICFKIVMFSETFKIILAKKNYTAFYLIGNYKYNK